MKCARCGFRRKRKAPGVRWQDKAICFTCWMDGWHFDAAGNVMHRDMVVSLQTALLLEINWREFAARNFTGDAA